MLEIIAETNCHPTADWIYQRLKDEMPDLSLGTVYRNLKVLAEQGLIRKLPFGSTFDRYEAKTEPHCHLVCEKCGVVKDFNMPQSSALNRRAEQVSDFSITGHRIDFFGMCSSCRNDRNASKKKGKEHER